MIQGKNITQAAKESKLLLTLSHAISSAPDFDSALKIALREICQTTHWIYGEAWIPTTDEAALVCSSSYYCQSQTIEDFRKYSELLTFYAKEEIPGQVWASQKSYWVADLSAIEDVLLRLEIAIKSCLKSAFGVPIIALGSNSEITTTRSNSLLSSPSPVLAVLVFFTDIISQEDQRWCELVNVLAAQSGTVLQQKKVQAEMKALFAAMTDVVTVRDVSGRCLNVIPTHSANLYKPSSSMIGRKLHQDLPPQQADLILKGIFEAVSTQKTVSIEYSLPIEGKEVWLAETISPLSDETAILVARDISNYKRSEEALRLIVEGTAAKIGEEFFQSCVRYLVKVLRVRYALLTEVVNENQTRVRTLAFWGGDDTEKFECDLDPEYDLYNTPCGTVYKDKIRYFPENLQSLFPNDPHLPALNAESYLGMLLTDSSGNTLGHLAVLDVKPMPSDPGRELILKIFASRAGAELERKQAEEKFVKAFRASPNPIAITSLSENRFIDVNDSFLKMCGYSLEEVIGHTSTELKLGVAQETYAKAIKQAIEAGSLHNQEFQLSTKSGSVKTVLISIEIIDLAGSQCVLNMINDITERKRLENELISLVSHELRTPMTSLLGALDLLGSGQLGSLTPQGEQVLSIATNNTERLTRLVNDILDLERMKSGKVVMQKVKCNIADLLIQATQAMEAMATKSQITLITEPINVELFADSDRILQTLTNLLSNAIKFSKPGGRIWLQAQVKNNCIEIQVKDEGRGIPADKLQTIFDRFQQVDASDSRLKGGTGLGLAICKNIVEQHEGKIWVESVLGKGSIFYVNLPLM